MKQILRLALKCVYVIFPLLIIWIYIGTHPLAFMDEEAPYYLWNKAQTRLKQEKQYDTLFLGDSTANAAYMPEILSDTSLNLALGGASPVENYYVLQEYLEHHPAPDVCYISFADQHFQDGGCFWTRTVYTHRFGMKQNREIFQTAAEYGDPLICKEDYMADFISYELWLPHKYITALLNAGFNQRYEQNMSAQYAIGLHGGRYVAVGNTEYTASEQTEYNAFHVVPFRDMYYRKILSLCAEKGIQVHIVRLPMPDNYVYTDSYKEDFDRYYSSLKQEYPGMVVDFMPVWDKSMFADGNHLNSRGALTFCRKLKVLYPEHFADTSFSESQIAAVNDAVAAENKAEWLTEWIAGMNYTLVLRDPERKYVSFCSDRLQNGGFLIGKNDDCGSDFYFISQTDDDGMFSLNETEVGLTLTPAGGDAQVWNLPDGSDLDIAVIDRYHGQVVCMKSFQYNEGGYCYMP